MRVEQTSATSFELQSDNGCVAIAGFATWTMGAGGVYWHQIAAITKEAAHSEFMKDPRVKAAMEKR